MAKDSPGTPPQRLSTEELNPPSIVDDAASRLRAALPEAFSDGVLNVGLLKAAVGEEDQGGDEDYTFRWRGKSAALKVAQIGSAGALSPLKDDSIEWDKTRNLFIEGESLEALKLLLKSYHRRIGLISIDPPYNTGRDRLYPGTEPDDLRAYLKYTSDDDNVRRQVPINPKGAGQFHTRWLNMMYPRLKVARHLLREDGYLVVSIDDTELGNLLKLLDEVFGEENRVAVLVIDRNRKNDSKFFSIGHEYALVYAKDLVGLRQSGVKLRAPKQGVEELKELFDALRQEHGDDLTPVKAGIDKYFEDIPEGDPREPLKRFTKLDEQGPFRDDGDASWPGGGGPTYPVLHPGTGKPCKVPSRGWVWPTRERMQEEIEKGRVVFGEDETTIPSIRRNLFDADEQVMGSVSFSYAQKATQEAAGLFDGEQVFKNPKDFRHVGRLIHYLTGPDDIVLDFFSHDATTAHAVLWANAEYGSARRFICVQFPAPLADDPYADERVIKYCTEQGITPNAYGLGRERLIRAGSAMRAVSETTPPDVGFRAFRLSESNFVRWDTAPDDIDQALLQAEDGLRPGSDPEDVFYELLLRLGYDLTSSVRLIEIAGCPVFVVGEGELVVCLSGEIGVDLAEGIGRLKIGSDMDAMRVVFSDSGFTDDVAKANAVRTLQQLGVGAIMSI